MEEDWVQFSLEGPLLLAVGCVGLVGNGFSVWVFARQRVQRVFHHLLLLLAIFDVVSSTASILSAIWLIERP
jgi:Co/Zn/Cd efflux system component